MTISRNKAVVRIGTRKHRVWQAAGPDLDNAAEWSSAIDADALDFEQAPDRCAGIFAAVRGSGMTITRAYRC